MRIANAVFIVAAFCATCAVCAGQSPAAPAPAPTATAAPGSASGILKPSLDTVQQTVTAVRLDKWKKGTVRDEAGDHIRAILKDLQMTLPSLLNAADAAPGTLSKELPVSHNINALYDVLLRVVYAARVSAPPEQLAPLEQALVGLSNARLALDDRLQGSAAAVEKQVGDLQSTVKTQAAKLLVPPAPVIVPCPPPPPVKKPRKKPTPPATKPQTSTSPATPAAPAPKPQN
jgi:hypothetical protein